MRTIKLPSGEFVPVLGQGTWHMGEQTHSKQQEIAALQRGIELGMNLIDTAEMYGDGDAECVVGEAIAARRDQVFLVSKVLPHNASRKGTIAACERSLRRLQTETIDLYLLHWRGSYPLSETIAAFQALQQAGKIRHWGVSNFDLTDMEELWNLPGGREAATNQVLYNLSRRGIEYDLLPRCAEAGLPVMAYSPIEQGRLLRHPVLRRIAQQHQASPAQVALAWSMRSGEVIAIPKAGTLAHVQDNREAADLTLDAADLAALDLAFAPPDKPMPLEMI